MTSVGPNSPSTSVDDATIGTLIWANPTNANASDNVYAVATGTAGVAETTHYILSTGFGFAIPAGVTIDGIAVEVEAHAASASVLNTRYIGNIFMVDDGTIGGNNGATLTNYTTTDAYKTYGGATSLWGGIWTPTKINLATFGVAFSFDMGNAGEVQQIISVDHVRITVYYTLGGMVFSQRRTAAINRAAYY